jgi:hypothetical protein
MIYVGNSSVAHFLSAISLIDRPDSPNMLAHRHAQFSAIVSDCRDFARTRFYPMASSPYQAGKLRA